MEQNVNKHAATNIDLSMIEPPFRDMVRNRIAAIEKYEAAPSRAAAERLAGEVGLGTSQFYNLLRAWRSERHPTALAGMKKPRGRRVGVSCDQSRLLDGAIARTGRTSPKDVARRAIAQAAEEGITMPPWDRVRRYVYERMPRRLPDELSGRADLIVEHSVLEPAVVLGDDAVERPLATFVIDAVAEKVVAVRLSHGLPSSRIIARGLLDAFSILDPNRIGTIRLTETSDDSFAALRMALEHEGLSVQIVQPGAFGHGRGMLSLKGLLNEGIRLRPRLVCAGSERRAKGTAGKPILPSLYEAETIIRARWDIPAVLDTRGVNASDASSGVQEALEALAAASPNPISNPSSS